MSFWDIVWSAVSVLFCTGLSALIVAVAVYLIYTLYIRKLEPEEVNFTPLNKLFFILMIPAFIYFGSYEWFGDHQIGSIFECKNYQDELYYAHLYPEDGNLKNYKVVVELDRVDGKYRPSKAYFNARQYLIIDYYYDNFEIGRKTSFKDQNNEEWYMELTNQKAEKVPD